MVQPVAEAVEPGAAGKTVAEAVEPGTAGKTVAETVGPGAAEDRVAQWVVVAPGGRDLRSIGRFRESAGGESITA